MDYILLAKKTKICIDCKNIVVGKGNLKAKILFVGEAPGRNEDEQGLPFVGAAGKNLDSLLAKVGLTIEDIYVTNILKCRPPENREPLPEEVRAHTPWLIEQIKEMKPRVVCSLGNHATKFFLAGLKVEGMERQPGITLVHGKVRIIKYEDFEFKLIPLFHPAAIIYNRGLIEHWKNDMEIVKREISWNNLI
jgi:uracil-DNA glycosylase